MSRLGTVEEVRGLIADAKRRYEAQGLPFHADALAAALDVSYERLAEMAQGKGVSAKMGAVLSAALQDCTANVLSFAMAADAKHHALYMWYLRNRGGFSDKGGAVVHGDGGVTFIGEGRI